MNFLMMSNAEAYPPTPHTKDQKQKALAGASRVERKLGMDSVSAIRAMFATGPSLPQTVAKYSDEPRPK